jgi:hypothetical protein
MYPESAAGAGVRLRIQTQDGVASARIRAVPLNVETALASILAGESGRLAALDPIRLTLADLLVESEPHAAAMGSA